MRWIGVEPQDITPELAESFGLQKSSGTIIAAGDMANDFFLSAAESVVAEGCFKDA